MTCEAFLARIVRRDWLTGGPLKDLITPYIEALQARRYAGGTIGQYLRKRAAVPQLIAGKG